MKSLDVLIDKLFGEEQLVTQTFQSIEVISTTDGKWVGRKANAYSIRQKYGITWRMKRLYTGYAFSEIPDRYRDISNAFFTLQVHRGNHMMEAIRVAQTNYYTKHV